MVCTLSKVKSDKNQVNEKYLRSHKRSYCESILNSHVEKNHTIFVYKVLFGEQSPLIHLKNEDSFGTLTRKD